MDQLLGVGVQRILHDQFGVPLFDDRPAGEDDDLVGDEIGDVQIVGYVDTITMRRSPLIRR